MRKGERESGRLCPRAAATPERGPPFPRGRLPTEFALAIGTSLSHNHPRWTARYSAQRNIYFAFDKRAAICVAKTRKNFKGQEI